VIVTVVGTILIVASTIAIGVVLDRKLGILPRPEKLTEAAKPKQLAHSAGEAPVAAIRAGSSQIAKLRESQRCPACRAAMRTAGEDDVQYNGRRLRVLTFQCTSCSTKRAVYIEPI
jgi:hypothetical protein